MSDAKLKTLLRQNPKAAKHEDSIRSALNAVRKLRDAGFGSDAVPVLSPYSGGAAAIRRAPKKPYRDQLKAFAKVTFSA